MRFRTAYVSSLLSPQITWSSLACPRNGHAFPLFQCQAESGKSTLQKPASLNAEHASWKIVIFYNVAHAIRNILNRLEHWGHLTYQNLPLNPLVSHSFAPGLMGELQVTLRSGSLGALELRFLSILTTVPRLLTRD